MSICVRQRVLIKICRELLKIARKIVDSTSLISPKHIFTATKEETKNQVSSVHKIFALVRLHIAIRCTPPKKNYLPEHNVPSQRYARAFGLSLSKKLQKMPDAAQNNFKSFSLSGSIVTFELLNFIYGIFCRFSQKGSNKIEEERILSRVDLCKYNSHFYFETITFVQLQRTILTSD